MIAYKLHLEMAKNRLKMKDVAERADLSVQAVSRIYHGQADRIDRSTLDKLCKALNCQVQDLLEYVPDPDTESGSE